ncbi:Smr domain-containing protein [Favolaschia claudopus]|uniref:Smr domain-containing protein n=1 Tax=Favolaschia claudopus TaxID=2862362 RepID=A0AAW0DZ21_9AGAR
MDPLVPLSLLVGFGLRIFLLAFDRHAHLRPILVGIWDGVALYNGLCTTTTTDNIYMTFAACALRLLVDCLFIENRYSMITLLLSLVLSALVSDVVGSHHGHDTQRSRRRDPPVAVEDGLEKSPPVYFREVSGPRRTNRLQLSQRDPQPITQASVSAVAQSDINEEMPHFTVSFQHPPSSGNIHAADELPSPVAFVSLEEPKSTSVQLVVPENRSPLIAADDAVDQSMAFVDDAELDELQTPPVPSSSTAIRITVVEQISPISYAAQDELQTPLAINLRTLPPLILENHFEEETRSLLLEDVVVPQDSASVLAVDDADHVSVVSSPSGTELSIISGIDAQMIAARADVLRKQAWAEDAQRRTLESQLDQAIRQHRTKDAFLLRCEIGRAQEQVRNLHRRAARRHFRARNTPTSNDPVDVHGLLVPEAIKTVELSLEAAIQKGRRELQVIVGRGRHSRVLYQPKLRPAIMEEMERQSIPCRVHMRNPGVLILTVPS